MSKSDFFLDAQQNCCAAINDSNSSASYGNSEKFYCLIERNERRQQRELPTNFISLHSIQCIDDNAQHKISNNKKVLRAESRSNHKHHIKQNTLRSQFGCEPHTVLALDLALVRSLIFQQNFFESQNYSTGLKGAFKSRKKGTKKAQLMFSFM